MSNIASLHRNIEQPNARPQSTQSPTILNNKIATLKVLADSIISEIDSLEQSRRVGSANSIDLNAEVHRFEADLVRSALVRTGGRQRAAARLLNIKPTTLHEKIKRFGISAKDLKAEASGYRTLEDHDIDGML